MKKNSNLTEGPILKSILKLSVPIILANLLQTAYQLTDTFWVGRLGTDAIAAVSISFPIIFLIISLGGGLAMAGSILVAQFKGMNDAKSVNHITGQTFLMIIAVSIMLSIVGYFLSPTLIQLMGAEASVYPKALSYMQISFIGIIFTFLFAVFQSLMRSVGEVKMPAYIVLGTVFLNLILDPLFIFGWKFIPAFGVGGAAVSTIGTQALSAVIGIFLLLNGKYHIKIELSDLRPDFKVLKKMIKIGVPASIEQSARALGMTVMTFLVATFGTFTLAAYGIGSRVLAFIIIPALGFSIATSALVGQNIGAGNLKRAEKIVKTSYFTSFISLTIIGILLFIFAAQISAVFVPGEIATIQESALFVRIMALTFGFVGIQMVLNGAFRGSGNTSIAMMMSIVSLWVLRFPIAYFLSKYTSLGQVGIWISLPISNVVTAGIATLIFLKGDWKKKKITEDVKFKVETTEETMIEEGLD